MQLSAPDDDDGGLVAATDLSLTCLSCPHSRTCGHIHTAGRVVQRPTHSTHHSIGDMHTYLHKVHAAISPDGHSLKLHGFSRRAITWTSLKATMATSCLYQQIGGVKTDEWSDGSDADTALGPFPQAHVIEPGLPQSQEPCSPRPLPDTADERCQGADMAIAHRFRCVPHPPNGRPW